MVAGIGGLALFVFLFFDWFGAGIEGFDDGVSGWDGLGLDFSGFIVALSSFAGVALALLAMTGQKLNLPLPRGGGTAILGLLSIAIIVWRIFANPGDLKFGLFLGLAAAIAIAAGALMALREDGYEPLVSVPGGRTSAATASAPPATPEPPTTEAPPTAGTATGASASPTGSTRSSGASATKRAPAKKPVARSTEESGSRSRSSASKSATSKPASSRSSGAKRSSGSAKK